MDRFRLLRFLVVLGLGLSANTGGAQPPKPKESIPTDLKMVFRPVSGSNRFRVGEEIRLQLEFSSSATGRYLAPCAIYYTSHFGPHCRFVNRWSFEISPAQGWVDLAKEFPLPGFFSGPNFEIPSYDLTAVPAKIPFVLTKFFRFDKPGKYKVRLRTRVGLDDASTEHTPSTTSEVEAQHFVSVSQELTIRIVPPSAGWLKDVIRKGVEAYSSPLPRSTNPPSPEFVASEAARDAFCKVGTPNAARALVKLLAAGNDEVAWCVKRTASPDAAIAELQRLMVAPNTAVDSAFFDALVALQSRRLSKQAQMPMMEQDVVDSERNTLFAALGKKQDEALIPSLATVLRNPPLSPRRNDEFAYTVPFDDAVIRMAAAKFNDLPENTQEWLLQDGWAGVRSPLMLAVVRRSAEKGNGDGLLRWYELDRAGAEKFARAELVRPAPRFSSYTLRLPVAAVTESEQRQLAENFVALGDVRELSRAASLLHRYATRAVLPVVLPFVDAHLKEWPCSVSAPIMAYLLKVAPQDTESRVERAIVPPGKNTCPDGEILTAIGTLEPSPILDRVAAAQVDGHTAATRDALESIRRSGSPEMKPVVWGWLERWQREIPADTKVDHIDAKVAQQAEWERRDLLDELIQTFTAAHGWIVTPEDAKRLKNLIGEDSLSQLSCAFSCGTPIAVGPAPGSFYIYGHPPRPMGANPEDSEYLNTTERLRYSVNQYACRTMRGLKEKLLQFPVGSTFGFAWQFDERDESEILEIDQFLTSHGFLVRNDHSWSFMPPDAAK